jgi:hypothetical protein
MSSGRGPAATRFSDRNGLLVYSRNAEESVKLILIL